MIDLFTIATKPATAERPLNGLTVLLVEDSRFSSEAVRLLCLRSGARIRRADCLQAARRHLQTYRPDVVIVDMGLPDGFGADLIAETRRVKYSPPVVLGLSGDCSLREAALKAGADGFLSKPIESLAMFQKTILAALPPEMRPKGLRALRDVVVEPDRIALQDDLKHMAAVLRDEGASPYAAHFLAGVAISARDAVLCDAADRLGQPGGMNAQELSAVTALVEQRLAASGMI